MPEWTLHWLEAEGSLEPWYNQLTSDIAAVRQKIAALVELPRLDVVIERAAQPIIPERGFGGHAYRPSMLALRVDPNNPNFESSLAAGLIRRGIAHEVHHCLRMAGLGYGRTLGEALVSEGLACHFSRFLFGGDPDPWEAAVDDAGLRVYLPNSEELWSPTYNHAEWFFGKGRPPRWYGYALGCALVEQWLATMPEMAGQTWINSPAKQIVTAGMARFS